MIQRYTLAALALCCCLCPSLARADSVWAVVGGETRLLLDRPTLDQYGIEIQQGDADLLRVDPAFDQNVVALHVNDGASMSLTEVGGMLTSRPIGDLRHGDDIIIRHGEATIVLRGFKIVPIDTEDGVSFDIYSGSSALKGPMLHVADAKIGMDHASSRFLLEAAHLAISEELADAMGSPKLAGLSIGALEVVAPATWTGGDALVEMGDVLIPSTGQDDGDGAPRDWSCQGNTGPDVIVGEMHEIANYASESVGGVLYDAFSVGTYSCNIGTQTLQWISGDSGGIGLHPVIGQNFYRYYTASDGATRFEQLGQSWLKHGFFALQNNLCCTCQSGSGGSALGVGCADPYAATRNGGQSGAGPKWQVNPSTGVHIHPISNPGGYSSNTGRRLRIREADLNEPGALYFVESQYIAKDDAEAGNDNNNASYRQITVGGSAGGNRTFSLAGTTMRSDCAIRAWKHQDPSVTETDVQVPNDGLIIVSAKATNIGGGLFHYEYAVQNLNSHRGVKVFSIPVDPAATVSNIGFRDVNYYDNDGEGAVTRDGTDWTGSAAGGVVSWTMTDIGANSNALLWGTLYNFRFDCDQAPTSSNATLTLFRTGSPASVTAATVGPAIGPQDCQPNGVEDSDDIANGTSQDCNNDGVPDECQSFEPCNLAFSEVITGLSVPVGVYAAPGDTSRLFVVEQTGRIKIVNLPSYTVEATPYLNLSSIVSSSGERGLLGLAFHPNWQNNAYFYVNYTNTSGNTVVARYQATGGNPASNTANAGSATILKTITQDFANHNGGCIQFGPDGKLYVGMGDGGNANDPFGRAQSNASLLGKMLRLDVDNPPTYVPADNPGSPHLPEVWAKGLRNPWRFSFDRLTGDLWIADVGQDAREEINFTAAGSPGGLNYGWRCMEGTLCTGLSGCTCNVGLVLPIREESHGDGQGTGSITGGHVYRGCEMPWLSGSYFYADYLGNYIKRFRYNGSVTDLQTEQAAGGAIQGIVSFGEDAAGEMYVVSILGSIYKIVCAAPPSLCGNGELDPGEQCDDGNDIPGDGCFNCMIETNDNCDDAFPITDGLHPFSTIGATTDGEPHAQCVTAGDGGQTFNDIWYDYLSPCNGTLTVTTCDQLGGSASYDTDLVLYTWDGESCTSRIFVACNDDDPNNACGASGGGFKSTIITPVVAWQRYLIRVGGWNSGNFGTGNLLVSNSAFPCGECGNDIVEAGEQCDPPGEYCNSNCQFANGDCNNNGVDDGEDIDVGNSFDCNNNGIPDDCEPSSAVNEYNGSGAGYPAAIPDNNATGVVRTITVPTSYLVTDVNVLLNITHTWVGDLCIEIEHNGTTVAMIQRMGEAGTCHSGSPYGCAADNLVNVIIDDQGVGGTIEDRCTTNLTSPPSYTPNNPLSAFNGMNAQGTWNLRVIDRASGDTGSLVSWGLIISTQGEPIDPCDCNENGITDAIDIANGTSQDCNNNGIPDECDIAAGGGDCDGGPTGAPSDGGILISTFCFGCHGPGAFGVDCGGPGGPCPGPSLRNKSRTTISNKLLPPTNHPGGAFPGFTAQDFADLEAFLNDTGNAPARPDGILDACQDLPDCNENGVSDGCEFGAGTQNDANHNGIPDDCEGCVDDIECDDDDPCTEDVCDAGECINTPIDSDQDGTPDCEDDCPNDPEKTSPGNCGCGNPETPATGDMDGSGDVDGADLQLFVNAIMDQSVDTADLCPGDFNDNGVMDVGDVDGMVAALLAP